MSDFIDYRNDDGIVTLTLQAPEEHNALTGQDQFGAFVSVCERINRDPEVKVVILTGAGKSFCAGGNVKDMKARAGLFHGDPIGAGCDLALMCDIRIASSKARFAESFVKLGIVPGDGGAWLLQRAVNNLSRAHELAYTGETINAATALEYGLVSSVVEPESLLDSARELAQRIAANPNHALRLTKKLMRESQHLRLEPLLELSAAYQALAHHTEAHAAILRGL